MQFCKQELSVAVKPELHKSWLDITSQRTKTLNSYQNLTQPAYENPSNMSESLPRFSISLFGGCEGVGEL